MANKIRMDYPFQVLRGWPGGVTEQNMTIKAGVTVSGGDFVAIQADGTIDLAKGVGPFGQEVGLVVVGNGDSGAAKDSNQAVVVFGNVIAKTTKYNTSASIAPGAKLTVKGTAGQPAVLDVAGASDPVVAVVRAVGLASESPEGMSVAPITVVLR